MLLALKVAGGLVGAPGFGVGSKLFERWDRDDGCCGICGERRVVGVEQNVCDDFGVEGR